MCFYPTAQTFSFLMRITSDVKGITKLLTQFVRWFSYITNIQCWWWEVTNTTASISVHFFCIHIILEYLLFRQAFTFTPDRLVTSVLTHLMEFIDNLLRFTNSESQLGQILPILLLTLIVYELWFYCLSSIY